MISIDPQVATRLQSELSPGERIHWAAMPRPRIIFHSDDLYMIPFSLLWGGFAIFWEASVLGIWDNNAKSHPGFMSPMMWFFSLWGIPFVLMGQYFIWGRFVVDAWLKRRTYYAVTDCRVLVLQQGWKRKTQFAFLESIPEISREGNESGTLWLGTKLPVLGGRGSSTRSMSRFSVRDGVPTLADIDDLDSVYHLILDLREQARKQSSPST